MNTDEREKQPHGFHYKQGGIAGRNLFVLSDGTFVTPSWVTDEQPGDSSKKLGVEYIPDVPSPQVTIEQIEADRKALGYDDDNKTAPE